jgi:hypothetical protein
LREVIIAADAMTAATFTAIIINKRCRTCVPSERSGLAAIRGQECDRFMNASYHKRKDRKSKKEVTSLEILSASPGTRWGKLITPTSEQRAIIESRTLERPSLQGRLSGKTETMSQRAFSG